MVDLITGEDRLNDILNHGTGTIIFDSSQVYPDHEAYADPWYSRDSIGDGAVSDNMSSINTYSENYGVDKDLLSAVVYMENSHGWYDGVNPNSATVRPGNVNTEVWASLLNLDPYWPNNYPEISIELTAKILAEIQLRLPNATPAAIATLYNNLRADMISGYGLTIEDYMKAKPWEQHCFLAGTQISMWDGTKKPIEQIEAGDIVVSYDKDGNLKPGRVKRTMTNRSKQILDVHGLMVTPGHATLCGDGRFNGQHVPILDILRSDGALVLEDGSKIRAGTGCRLGTMGDRIITAIIGEQAPGGLVRIAEVGQIRAGTRFITEDGEDVSVLDMILASGGRLTEDGMIQTSTNGPKMPFRWTLTSSLPKPEDYVLQRSATHLQDIYQANEWESVRPSMPIPTGGEAGATISKHPAIIAAAPVNVPLALHNRPDAPQMSRKYRRAAEAKVREKRGRAH
jgi:hypothetical protein